MQIYFVYDGWEETSVWEIQFYATKELAEVELNTKIAKLHEINEVDYQRKLEKWKIKSEAVKAVVAAGLPVPYELSWIESKPPVKKDVLSHGLCVDYVEVQE